MGTRISLLLAGVFCAGALFAAEAPVRDNLKDCQSNNQALSRKSDPLDESKSSPGYKNLLTSIGAAFVSPDWNQGNFLNSTAYGSLLALSIDASAAFGKPIILDPDSTSLASATVDEYIRVLNQRNYLEYRKKPFYALSSDRLLYAFSEISVKQIPNDKGAKDVIKSAVDNNQAVVFTYNFNRNDCFSLEEFFRLKFNLGENEKYIDDSSYDSLYDGEHTMCIVGYDDSDESFIIQDSRSGIIFQDGRATFKQFTLPGLRYLDSKQSGMVKISQNLDYANYLPRLNGLSSAYRHEFFVLTADWVKNDSQPPKINDLKIDTVHASPDSKHYSITANITDDVKVAYPVKVSISIPNMGDATLYNVLIDEFMTSTLPILGPESMSAPMMTAVTVTAADTSGNEAVRKIPCYFPHGLPLSLFSETLGSYSESAFSKQFYASTKALAVAPASETNSIMESHLENELPFLPQATVNQSIIARPGLISYLGREFIASQWEQTMNNCVAYGSLVAISIEASKSWGRSIVLDPDSTLQAESKVPDYIAKMNKIYYFNKWKSPTRVTDNIFTNDTWNTYKNRYPFSSISIQQIPNNSNAKNAIKAAIDNNQAVVFRYGYYSSYASDILDDFWKEKPQDNIFYDINASGGSGNRSGNGGHVMCIVGYDDTDQSFIVQNSWGTPNYIPNVTPSNRPRGTLKIPQNLNYTAWNYHVAEWPLTIFGGEYRFEFYKLIPAWITGDTQAPVIHTAEANISRLDSNMYIATLPYRRLYGLRAHVTDNVRVADVAAKIIFPSGKTYNVPLMQSTSTQGGNFTTIIPIFINGMSAPVTATVTIVASDTSGNMSETQFQFHFAAGFPGVI